ncbi:MAG TPA: MFS transporter [Thermoanaerobaculia bacterium]|nr:MFS transporter [Thermoanaerobaculia bacterium]
MAEADQTASLRGANAALAVLTFINLFNYLDRYVVASLVESLKKSELALSDTQAGSLVTGFVIVYMLTSPLFGTLGDRRGRPGLLALGVGIWSLATALGGFARSFFGLFAARAAVGVGEAAYGTIAPALLADSFPEEKRGRVFAIFFAAIPIGSAAGFALGGWVDQHYGWRSAFFIAGVPGLLLALLCLLLKDPPRGARDVAPHPGALPRGDGGSYFGLLKNRSYRLTVLGYAAYTFVLGGVAFWTPAFLERIRGMSKTDATIEFGAIVVVTGFVGTFVGGWLGDFFLKRSKNAYLLVSGWATIAAAPFAVVAFVSPHRSVFLPAMVVTQLLMFASTGPINSAIVNVVAPTERARALALSILGIHLLGDVPSPPLIGALSDATSLETAFLVWPAVIVVAGAIWLYAAWRT